MTAEDSEGKEFVCFLLIIEDKMNHFFDIIRSID